MKDKASILREALAKLEQTTSIKAIGPGSVARAFTEAITNEIGDMYSAMDFNLNQAVLSTATGAALDMIGSLYGVSRRQDTDLVATDKKLGSFYFYVDTVHTADITIPAGTKVYTSVDSFVGRQLSFSTTAAVTIPAYRLRAFASLTPDFSNAIFNAAVGTLTIHDFANPAGVFVKCTNPKAIASQFGFETDDNYRVRISKQIRVSASGTYDAIRFSGLSVNNVREIVVRQAPFGMGTFEVMVVPEDRRYSDTTIREVTNRIQRVAPVGVRWWVKAPVLRAMDISATIVVNNTVRGFEQIGDQVSVGIRRYLNSLMPGEVLVYNKLIQAIMEVSSAIQDVQITRYAPNGVETVRRNFQPGQDEIIIPGRLEISTA